MRVISVPTALLYGVLAGFGIAMPLGAIAVLLLRTGMTHGFRAAAAAGLGAASVDLAYCAAAFAVGSSIAGTIQSWGGWPLLVSGAVLAGIGAIQLRGAFRGAPDAPATPLRSRHLYTRFVALTALNPATVLYFVALASALASRQADAAARVAFVAGTGLASAMWQVGLAAVGALLHRGIGQRASRVLGIVGSAIVMLLGGVMIARGIEAFAA